MFRIFTLLCFVFLATLQANPLFMAEPKSHIEVNNRVLVTAAGVPITTIDVMKAMDLNFYRRYAEYASSNAARYQFYVTNWKTTLRDLIDKELALADAKETKLDITPKEIRQEMDEQFGPNIISNLHKAGLTYDETWNMIRSDMLLRRMMIFRVQAKAVRSVTPQMIRASYEENKENYHEIGSWNYYIIAIRDKNEAKGKEMADKLLSKIQDKPIEEINDVIAAEGALSPSTNIKISEELSQNENDLSPAYREVLESLYPGAYSAPLRQESRAGSILYRIFYLKSNKAGGLIPFTEVTPQIKNQLVSKQMEIQMDKYLSKLRKRFGIDMKKVENSIPADYTPFNMMIEK